MSPTSKSFSQPFSEKQETFTKSPSKINTNSNNNLKVGNIPTITTSNNDSVMIQSACSSLQSSPMKALSPTRAFKAHEESLNINKEKKESKRMAKQPTKMVATGDSKVKITNPTLPNNNNKQQDVEDDDDDVFIDTTKAKNTENREKCEQSTLQENVESNVSIATTAKNVTTNKTTDIKTQNTFSRDSNVVGDTANR